MVDAYAAAVAVGGLPFLQMEESRGFKALRALRVAAPSIPSLLALMSPPAEAALLAPLPLPAYPTTPPAAGAPPPLPPPEPFAALASFSARQPALLAALTLAGAPPPCASSAPPLPLEHPLRALRRGDGDGDGGGDGGGGGAWLGAGRGGPELRACDAPGAPPWVAGVRAWAAHAAAALPLLAAALAAPPLAAGGARGEEWLPRAVLLLAPLCCAVPWTHPALARAAAAALGALEGAAGAAAAASAALPGAALARELAPALLAAVAREAGAGGGGAPPGGARFALPWLLRRLPQRELEAALPAALAAAHRVCDDWDATSTWCGVSAARALLEGASLSAVAPWGGAFRELLARAGAGAAHPLVAASIAHARACALAAGGAVEPPAAPLARLCAGGAAALAAAHAPLLDSPYDAATLALLRDAALAARGELLLAHVHALPPLLLAMGPWAARHAAAVAAAAARCVEGAARSGGGGGGGGGGGALAAAALHAVRAAAAAAPAAFDGAADAAGGAPLLHEAVALCLRAALQARAAAAAAGGGGAEEAALVEAHARACLAQLRAGAPVATAAALAVVEAGRDARDALLADTLRAVGAFAPA
jgi:hypothetical protein